MSSWLVCLCGRECSRMAGLRRHVASCEQAAGLTADQVLSRRVAEVGAEVDAQLAKGRSLARQPGEEQCEVCGRVMPRRFLGHHLGDHGWCGEEVQAELRSMTQEACTGWSSATGWWCAELGHRPSLNGAWCWRCGIELVQA